MWINWKWNLFMTELNLNTAVTFGNELDLTGGPQVECSMQENKTGYKCKETKHTNLDKISGNSAKPHFQLEIPTFSQVQTKTKD